MSIYWKDCTPQDGWRCRSCRPLHATDMMGLLQLYQPLIGTDSVGFYTTLYYQLPFYQGKPAVLQKHESLMKILQLTMDKLLQARYRLEGVGLVNTYRLQGKKGRYFEYELVPPLSPSRFFQSDVLSISLLNRLGKECFQALYKQMIKDSTPTHDTGGVVVTKNFQDVFGALSPADILSAGELGKEFSLEGEGHSEKWEDGKAPSFAEEEDDLAMVKARLRHIVDDEAWTPEVEEQLREIRFLFQLNDLDLIRALKNPYVTSNGRIALDRLRSFVKSQYRMQFGGHPPVVVDKRKVNTRQEQVSVSNQDEPPSASPDADKAEEIKDMEEERHFRKLAVLSPLELLRHFQKGKQVPKADVDLVERLSVEYGLPGGVINVLLEYVLYSYDYKLPRSLVEKIAGHWARKGVETVEDAREMAQKELNWDWKKRDQAPFEENRHEMKKKNWRGPRREDKLPRAVLEGMEAAEKEETQGEADPEAEARIRAKLNRMRQRMNQRSQEKGNNG